jgi:hypothetical protein
MRKKTGKKILGPDSVAVSDSTGDGRPVVNLWSHFAMEVRLGYEKSASNKLIGIYSDLMGFIVT